MHNMRTKKLALSLLIFFPLLAVAEEGTIEEVLVTATPIRDSQAAAIEAKRESDNVVDILSADTIGRFPDQNLADSLGRVPGLAIERDQGQARFINFRGAPFRYTKIAFDGIDVLGAEDGRIPRFDSFPAVITSRLEINKAITPDLPGESTVGLVNIETFKPSSKEGLSFGGEFGQGNQELGDVQIDKWNGRISFSNETFGFLLFGSHNLRGRVTDNREFEFADTDGDGVDDSSINLDFRSYRGEREDNARGGSLEFYPSENSRVFISTLFSEFIDREERNQFDFDFAPIELGGSAFVEDVEVQRLLEDGTYENSTFTNTLGFDGFAGEWYLEARVNYTETENDTFLPLPLSVGGSISADIDIADIDNPILIPSQPGAPGIDININRLDFAATLGLIFRDELETEAFKYKIDLERNIDFVGESTTLKVGGSFDIREAQGGSALAFGGFPDSVDINDFVTDTPFDTDFNNTISGTNVNNQGLIAAWAQAVGGLGVPFDDDETIGIDEDITSAYVKLTSEFGWGNLVYGVRVEHTDFSTTGSQLDGDGVISPLSVDNDYTNVLPSIHANIPVGEQVVVRLSASSGLSRPRYSELRASRSIDPEEFEITGGNPELDAEESFGFDAALEWYFSTASLLSVNVYHRQIDNVIYPATSIVDGGQAAPGVIDPGTPTVFNSFFNGDDGELTGYELNFIGSAADILPAPFDGLGFSGNITFVDSQFTAPLLDNQEFDLPGTSDLIYNASLFYEKAGFSARVNYQFRDDWLSTTENDSLTEFWAETERVDATIRYTFQKPIIGANLTLALSGNNLTDERDVRFINNRNTPNQIEGFGRRWVFSVRVDY